MKTFDICKDVSGSRIVIYPGGTRAKRESLAKQCPRHYYDPPYIDVRKAGPNDTGCDTAELVRGGQVCKRVYLWANDPNDGQCKQLINLMKEL